MDNQHTPGPWRIDWSGGAPTRDESNCELVCLPHPTFDAIEIFCRSERDHYDEHQANARLIAAAPDLLEALAEASATLSNIPAPHNHSLWVRMCRAIRRAEDAIAKARHAEPSAGVSGRVGNG